MSNFFGPYVFEQGNTYLNRVTNIYPCQIFVTLFKYVSLVQTRITVSIIFQIFVSLSNVCALFKYVLPCQIFWTLSNICYPVQYSIPPCQMCITSRAYARKFWTLSNIQYLEHMWHQRVNIFSSFFSLPNFVFTLY